MKNKLLVIFFVQALIVNLSAQTVICKDSVMKYLNNHKNLDPIEGIWTLHVVGTLFQNNDSIAEETCYMWSEWAVVKEDNLRFKIIDFGGKRNENSTANFDAYFKKTNSKGLYTYKCKFINPNWTAKSKATLTDGFILNYEYFTSNAYMKTNYKEDYESGLKLRWKFTWTKQYPEPKYNYNTVSEANQSR